MNNNYGLDVNYFASKLKLIVADIHSYTPQEMARELSRLAKTAHLEAALGEFSSAVPYQLPGVVEHSGEPVAHAHSLGDGDFRIDYSFPEERDFELFTHPAPSQPSAEAIVQAALEAAVNECESIALEVQGKSNESDWWTAKNCSRAIRALDKQQIIESCKEKS